MAKKYVSVSELRKLLGIPADGKCSNCQFSTFHGCKDDSLRRACEAIDDAPEADVRPVVRGVWEYISFMTCRCSVCKEIFHELAGDNFCPNCGADMREKTDSSLRSE